MTNPKLKTALVTGGSRGLGEAIAKKLSQSGLEVWTPSREDLDLAQPESVLAYCEKIRDFEIDILINNAGINVLNSIEDVNFRDVDLMWNVLLRSPMVLAQQVSRSMIKKGMGRIVNMSSVLGKISRERRVVYSTMKAGLDGLTRSLAVELGPKGILVNAVAPGYIDTDLTRKNNPPDVLAAIQQTVPLKKLGTPGEIAELVLFLSSPQNSYINGQVIYIDGGLVIS